MTEDDEERFDGFWYFLKTQVQRIVTSGYKTFTADVDFIKTEHNGLDGKVLCNLSSRDSNEPCVSGFLPVSKGEQ